MQKDTGRVEEKRMKTKEYMHPRPTGNYYGRVVEIQRENVVWFLGWDNNSLPVIGARRDLRDVYYPRCHREAEDEVRRAHSGD